MNKYVYNGITLPALPTGLNDFNYIVTLDGNYYLASAITEEKTLNANGAIRVSSSEGVLYKVSGDAWVESGYDNVSGTVVWCDTDMYNTDGTLYLPASTPVPVGGSTPLDPTALLMGWMVGKRVAGLRKTQTDVPVVPDVPIAYLYNGVRLPDINEVWTDKETYKYALITVGYDSAHTADYYELFLSDQPVTARAYDTGDASYLNNSGATMNCLRFVLNGNAWGEHPTDYNSTLSNGKFKSGSGTFLYANYDVLKKADGTTDLAPSEPIPGDE